MRTAIRYQHPEVENLVSDFGERLLQSAEERCGGKSANELHSNESWRIVETNTGKVFVKERAMVTAGQTPATTAFWTLRECENFRSVKSSESLQTFQIGL